MDDRIEKFLEILFLVALVSVGLIFTPLGGVAVSNNTARYLAWGNDFYHGDSTRLVFEDLGATRGVFFPWLLATSFRVLGKSVHSASIITRVWFVLSIITVYVLGRAFYGRLVGTAASVLVLTSYGINEVAINIDTDIVHPFFILAFIVSYYLALNRSSGLYAVVSGACLGLALMIKESAVLCLALPFGIFVLPSGCSRRRVAVSGLVVICVAGLSLVPWAIETFVIHGSLLPMLGTLHPGFQKRIATADQLGSPFAYWLRLFSVGVAKGLLGYYRSCLLKVTPMALPMVMGLVFVSVRGVMLKRLNDTVMAVSVLGFLPLFLRIGTGFTRLGHTTFVYMLLYVTLAVMLVSCTSFVFDLVAGRGWAYARRPPLRAATALLVTLVLTVVQLFAEDLGKRTRGLSAYQGGSTFGLWTKGRTKLAIFSHEPFMVYGRYTIEQQEAADWLKNVQSGSRIIADGFAHEALEFFDVGQDRLPVFSPKRGVSIDEKNITVNDTCDSLVCLLTYHSFDSGKELTRKKIWPIFESDILTEIRHEAPEYLVISARGIFFHPYFDRAEWAELAFSNSDVRIYRVDMPSVDVVMLDGLIVNDDINQHLNWLRENYHQEYLAFVAKLEELGLSVKDLECARYRFPMGKVY